jgi:hypothetical protein
MSKWEYNHNLCLGPLGDDNTEPWLRECES